MDGLFHAILLFVALQRLAELAWSTRNARRLKAAGAREVGRRHYPLLVLLHAGWLLSMAVQVPFGTPVFWPMLLVFVLLQAARVWVLVSLGRFWTTRILTLPGAPLVAHGPYRFMRHPNYLIVAAEIAVVPLLVGAWKLALIFSALNALLLAWRIRLEDEALAPRRRP